MTDLPDDQPGPADPASPRPMDVIRIGVCPRCEYDLKGLSFAGKCPECGTAYDEDVLLAPGALPSALSLCVRFGWPVMFVVVAGAPVLFGGDDPSLFCCALISLVSIPLNGIVQAAMLRRHPVLSQVHLKAVSPRVRRLSHIGLALLILTVVLPLVAFGGCVLLVLVSLGSIH